ncbi:myosin head [Dictyocaulus viviparus]|uniref:Myosin head n=1 Tax=Dictyocaulus viviparus TaxID=29172 RepID=A0A0D8XNI2_DICVI|nr:myosin head [Dictyocaulus viviparus]
MNVYENDPGWKYLRQSSEQLLAATAKKFVSRKKIWSADDDEGFIAAEIKSTKGGIATVWIEYPHLYIHQKSMLQQDFFDPKAEKKPCSPFRIVVLQLLAATAKKFDSKKNIWIADDDEGFIAAEIKSTKGENLVVVTCKGNETYSGLFCVVINPYKRLPIYTESVCKMYIGRRRNEMPPHLFAVSDEAYRNMQNDQENQSMLITGESGAGKTENTKKVISYFAMVGASQTKKTKKDKSSASLEDQIVQTNPVLEAFGNAKTVRNNNSSRFGKFIRIHFNKAGKVAGGDIEHYLLEKSRVIKQAPGERSYHIFYQIYSDAIKGLKGTVFCVPSSIQLQEAFDIMKFSQKEKDELFAITAGIMHMGELKMKQRPREEQAELDNGYEGELACKLFNVDFEKFVSSLLKPRVKVGSEWVNRGQNLDQVNWALGALAKALYARMFTWLINRCNKTLDAQDRSRDFFIGVLDIAGFEIFDLNSFEQLWINFVNEKLQQFFNHHMFVLEQEEYSRESIRWEFIDFGLDLQACIDLIEKPLGVISMLDEECIVPKANDITLALKLNDQHLGKHPNFQKPRPPKGKQAEAHLAIVHYAGTVRYNVTGWLEKNKDPLNDTAVTVLKANKGNQLLSDLWADYNTQEDIANLGKKAPGKKVKSTPSSYFLTFMIFQQFFLSRVIEANLVLNQLTCNGVLEGIRICRKGFPNRMPYLDFRQRYALLTADAVKNAKTDKEAGETITSALTKKGLLKVEEFQCGSTKVFFKAGVLAHLEELREEVLSVIITKLQCACRHYLALCEYKRKIDQKVGLLVIQRNVRAWCTLRTWHWFKLYGRVKPLIKGNKKDEEMETLKKICKELEESHHAEEIKRKSLEAENARLLAEKQAIIIELEQQREGNSEIEERGAKLLAQKSELEKQNADLNEQLANQEDRNAALTKARQKAEQDNEILRKTVASLETTINKHETEKQNKDHQIRGLQDEITSQDDLISKINKEKKLQEEVNRKLLDDMHAQEDKVNHFNKIKAKLESTLDEVEDQLEREKRIRQDAEKQKRKIEGELKVGLH